MFSSTVHQCNRWGGSEITDSLSSHLVTIYLLPDAPAWYRIGCTHAVMLVKQPAYCKIYHYKFKEQNLSLGTSSWFQTSCMTGLLHQIKILFWQPQRDALGADLFWCALKKNKEHRKLSVPPSVYIFNLHTHTHSTDVCLLVPRLTWLSGWSHPSIQRKTETILSGSIWCRRKQKRKKKSWNALPPFSPQIIVSVRVISNQTFI